MPARLPTGMQVFERGWLSSNNLLCVADQHAGLIDSGYVSHAPQTVALVRQALGAQTLNTLVNTHLHSDHCGGNGALQAAYPALHTAIPFHHTELLQGWAQAHQVYQAVGQDCAPFRHEIDLRPGDQIRLGTFDWQVLAAPGHDPTSFIYYCPEARILASADALWEHGFGVIFPELEGAQGFVDTRRTLDAIAALDIRMVVPGHGRPFIEVDAALERAYQRLDFLASEPIRNAQNALKVMLKFKLLEQQRMRYTDLLAWMSATPMMQQIHTWFAPQSVSELTDVALSGLFKAQAAQRQGEWVLNHEPA